MKIMGLQYIIFHNDRGRYLDKYLGVTLAYCKGA